MKIGVHQMCSGIDPEKNAAMMVEAIRYAGKAGAACYFAPEMSLLIDRDRERARGKIFAEAETAMLERLMEAAKETSIWVHLGSIPVVHEDGSGRLANRTLVIDDRGEIRARYDKIHMFDVNLATGEKWQESKAYRAGEAVSAVQTPFGLLGLAICYDVRFTDLFSALSRAGADFIAVPSAFTQPTGKAHWETLLRARAIETQSFIVAAAQSGKHEDGRTTYGHSLVVGPWGNVIGDMGEAEGVEVFDLQLSELDHVRSQIPVLQNRKKLDDNISVY